MSYRPYALLAELTYRCPLHCPYCSNPVQRPDDRDLTTGEWIRVIGEAAGIGVLQIGFSGGEPLLRPDLPDLVLAAREMGLYTNLITSGVGLDAPLAAGLQRNGLDSVQISFQADEPELADAIAGARVHERKLSAAMLVRQHGFAFSVNVVLHRRNISRLREIISFASQLGATRLELANTQYYGWAYLNRSHLLPTKEQVRAAALIAGEEKARLAGQMEIFYVVPDYFEERPKPCMNGWGQRHITVNPVGDVLPCPTASSILGLMFDSVRQHPLAWIWEQSDSFNRFRGSQWMMEPCRSCPMREIDFGGCRCQAALLTADPRRTDPVCGLSPDHHLVEAAVSSSGHAVGLESMIPRR